MCKKREEILLVRALAQQAGKDEKSIRQLLAKAAWNVRKAYRNGIYPRPQHLVEDLCSSFVIEKFPQDPARLATATLNFISSGFSPIAPS